MVLGQFDQEPIPKTQHIKVSRFVIYWKFLLDILNVLPFILPTGIVFFFFWLLSTCTDLNFKKNKEFVLEIHWLECAWKIYMKKLWINLINHLTAPLSLSCRWSFLLGVLKLKLGFTLFEIFKWKDKNNFKMNQQNKYRYHKKYI